MMSIYHPNNGKILAYNATTGKIEFTDEVDGNYALGSKDKNKKNSKCTNNV